MTRQQQYRHPSTGLMAEFHACEVAIDNLKEMYTNRFSNTSSKEGQLRLFQKVYDKKYSTMFNGKRVSYEQQCQFYLQSNEYFHGSVNDFEAEILDNTTIRYAVAYNICSNIRHHDNNQTKDTNHTDDKNIEEETQTTSDYVCYAFKTHCVAKINPKTGKIVFKKVMTGKTLMEMVDLVKEKIALDDANDRNEKSDLRIVTKIEDSRTNSALPKDEENCNDKQRIRRFRSYYTPRMSYVLQLLTKLSRYTNHR